MEIAAETQCEDLQELLGPPFHRIWHRAITYGGSPTTLRAMWHKTRKQLGILRAPQKAASLEDLPEPLRTQVANYVERASIGLGQHPDVGREIVDQARLHGYTLTALAPRTIQRVLQSIVYAVRSLSPTGPLSIEDLITCSAKEVQTPGSAASYTTLYNPLVDKLRLEEKTKQTNTKRPGFDSRAFHHLCTSVRTVAVYNGFYGHLKAFSSAYRISPDRESERVRKQSKKNLFSVEWFDGEIERLLPVFRKIVAKRTFLPTYQGPFLAPVRGLRSLYNPDLRFILFFVTFVTLRYLGFRQQLLRCALGGENVKFERGGTVTFYWEEQQNKNRRAYKAVLAPADVGNTHGVVLEVLRLYHDKVWPKIKGPHRHFFLATGRHKNPTHPHKDENGFFAWYTRAAATHLNYDYGVDGLRYLNPHHSRGICTDWLVYVIEMPLDDAAEFIGDTRHVMETKYLDKHRIIDAAAPLRRVNKVRNREEQDRKGAAATGLGDDVLRLLSMKDKQIEKLVTQLEALAKQAEGSEARNAALAAKSEMLEAEVRRVREEADLRQKEILANLNQLARPARRTRKDNGAQRN